MLTTTTSLHRFAWRISERCPSCKAPIVGTSAIRRSLRRSGRKCRRRSAILFITSILTTTYEYARAAPRSLSPTHKRNNTIRTNGLWQVRTAHLHPACTSRGTPLTATQANPTLPVISRERFAPNPATSNVSSFKDEHARQERPGAAPQRDALLVAQALAGDSAAFDELVGVHQRKAVAVASRLLGNLQDGLEVAQEAFLRAYRALETLQEPERFGPWLMRIVTNQALNYRRSRRTSQTALLEDFLAGAGDTPADARPGHSPESPLEAAATGELRQAIEKAITELPEKQRVALVCFAVEQMPQKEVAAMLGCSLEVVKWSVFQARKTLKEKLAKYL